MTHFGTNLNVKNSQGGPPNKLKKIKLNLVVSWPIQQFTKTDVQTGENISAQCDISPKI